MVAKSCGLASAATGPLSSLCAEAVAAGQKIAPQIKQSERNVVPIEISRVDGGR
jgi:hypothetical protein